VPVIRAAEDALLRRAVEAWSAEPAIEILGNVESERLSIVSFVVRRPPSSEGTARYLHHNYVVALLNDLFGIQSRGGCSCAGPYGHRLLGIDIERSHAFEREITHGCEGIKPGWVRVNFTYFLDEEVADYIIDAVLFVARHGARFLPDYTFDEQTGLWHHRAGPVEPPLRLSDVTYDETTGMMLYPRHEVQADASALKRHLDDAHRLAAERNEPACDAPTGMREDFEALRWFDLPAACLRT
jgi:hypothetical protein